MECVRVTHSHYLLVHQRNSGVLLSRHAAPSSICAYMCIIICSRANANQTFRDSLDSQVGEDWSVDLLVVCKMEELCLICYCGSYICEKHLLL